MSHGHGSSAWSVRGKSQRALEALRQRDVMASCFWSILTQPSFLLETGHANSLENICIRRSYIPGSSSGIWLVTVCSAGSCKCFLVKATLQASPPFSFVLVIATSCIRPRSADLLSRIYIRLSPQYTTLPFAHLGVVRQLANPLGPSHHLFTHTNICEPNKGTHLDYGNRYSPARQ